jgi:DNA-binding LacI/PurR family transcriptional regulator
MPVTDRARPATAADVAKHAGVSRATVSHILNGRDAKFPDETKARVRAAAEELDYRPSPAGRSLVTGHSDTIVVVMPNTTIGFGIQEALERLSEDLGSAANVVLRFGDEEPASTVRAILKLRPLAVIDFGSLMGPERDRLHAQGVVVVPDTRRPLTVDGVNFQDAIAILQVRELVKRGPRQIVYAGLTDKRSDPYGPSRMTGIERACHALGLPRPARINVEADIASATDALRSLEFPVGIAAYNDYAAVAILAAAARLGIDVPGSVSVVGTDATDFGRLWTPRLTSVAVDMRAVIDDAAAQLLEQLPDVLGRRDETAASPAGRSMIALVDGDST